MDTKNAIDALGCREMGQKVQGLGEKFYQLSERPVVSNIHVVGKFSPQTDFLVRSVSLMLDPRKS